MDVLREEIREHPGVNRGHTIVVVGAGNLGKALMGNFKFSHIGFRLAAAFDVNEKTIGTTIAGTPVYHEDQLEFFIREHHVDVGLLTVPRTVAQVTAEKLVNAGVKGIWNFTNQELLLPGHEDVIVESVHFSESLLALSYMISQKEDEEGECRNEEAHPCAGGDGCRRGPAGGGGGGPVRRRRSSLAEPFDRGVPARCPEAGGRRRGTGPSGRL